MEIVVLKYVKFKENSQQKIWQGKIVLFLVREALQKCPQLKIYIKNVIFTIIGKNVFQIMIERGKKKILK